MKKITEYIPLTRILLLFYIVLFIIVAFVRIAEHRNIRKTTAQIHELSNSSLQRQSLLNNIQDGYDQLLMNELKLLYYNDAKEKTRAKLQLAREMDEINRYINTYAPLISDSLERQLFNNIKIRNAQLEQYWVTADNLLTDGKTAEAYAMNVGVLQPAFENVQSVNLQLSEHVNIRDRALNQKLGDTIAAIERFARITTYVIGVFVIILGILLIITVRSIINNRNILARAEGQNRSFITETNELITRLDAEGRILLANKRFCELVGYSEEELKTLKVFEIMTEESAGKSERNLDTKGKEGAISKVSRVLVSKEGKKIIVEGNILWEYEKGQLVGLTGFFNDVTEKRLLEKSLQESEQQFRQLFFMAPIPMYIFDPETYRFLQVNDAALEFYGYTKEAFLEKTILDIRPQKEHDRTVREISSIIKKNKNYVDTYKHLKADHSSVDVEIYASSFLLENKQVVFASVVDISLRKLYENRITKAIIKTQEEERYEIGSELHDNVCQILASAKMSMGTMRPQLPDSLDTSYNQSLESIVLATEEIRNLSHRLAPVFFKNSTLRDSLEKLINTFNIGSHYKVDYYFDESISTLQLSRELQLNLYRILQEQLRNIIKYANATEIRLEIINHKNKLRMLIADNGVGFDPNLTPSGIGLANIKRRVEFFYGNVEISTTPGDGCEIVVTIPLSSAVN